VHFGDGQQFNSISSRILSDLVGLCKLCNGIRQLNVMCYC